MTSRIPGFYKKSIEERLNTVRDFAELTCEDAAQLNSPISSETADKMIENVIGTYSLPVGIAVNFLVNGKDYIIPMALEEPSVVAAASNAAKIARGCGGFTTSADESIMIGQIHLFQNSTSRISLNQLQDRDSRAARTPSCLPPWQDGAVVQHILDNKQELLDLANSQNQFLVSLGGGAKDIEVKQFDNFTRIHLLVDCRDAMGANIVNTMVEAIAPKLEELGGEAVLKIVSNLADRRLARAECVFKKEVLGEKTINLIIRAYQAASADPYRAATHNKGIMNAISAICVATGNDWRAVEAGAHSFANQKPLTKYELTPEGSLKASIELPIAVATVGGSTKHPQAQANLKILRVKTARELAQVMAAAGLAQNFAALKAITTEGIQKGHMKLHERKLSKQ